MRLGGGLRCEVLNEKSDLKLRGVRLEVWDLRRDMEVCGHT